MVKAPQDSSIIENIKVARVTVEIILPSTPADIEFKAELTYYPNNKMASRIFTLDHDFSLRQLSKLAQFAATITKSGDEIQQVIDAVFEEYSEVK